MFHFKKKEDKPALFHITHWKAGSQWIHHLLIRCFSKQIIKPQPDGSQFLTQSILPGKIYPTLYITYEQFKCVRLPKKWKRFVIIRDLRDTLISFYFSLKISHPMINPLMEKERKKLLEMNNLEKELIYLMNQLKQSAMIQQSWLSNNESIIRYEDLIDNDINILTPILKNFNLTEKKIKKCILATRFEKLTKGRKRGQEDITAHTRKGTPGDWKYYFSEGVKKHFKEKYGDLLIQTGYETNPNW